VEPDNADISISHQCELLEVSRTSYYQLEAVNPADQKDLEDLQLVLEVLLEHPFKGYRRISRDLIAKHPHMTRKRVRRVMHRNGLRALFPKHRTTKARKEHKKYPYLLKNKVIRYPNQVWASVTYCRLPHGYVYLVVVVDLYSRKILTWRLSNSLNTQFCEDALNEAIEIYGEPAIFNSDYTEENTMPKTTLTA